MGAVTVGTRAQVSPFAAFDRESWRTLAAGSELPLDAADVRGLASLGDRIDVDEVATVYLLLGRKGFPESYDRRALLRFLADVKSGVPEVTAPLYSHLSYDVLPEERQVVDSP